GAADLAGRDLRQPAQAGRLRPVVRPAPPAALPAVRRAMMYRYLAKRFSPPSQLFLVHPLQLSRFLETAWTAATEVPVLGQNRRTRELGSATVIGDFAMPLNLLLSDFDPGI